MNEEGTFAARVIAWQRHAGRHGLPWQQTRDPYRVWLSEVMLQQTQVATALPYYQRFLLRFPDVQRLAAASLDEVCALWSGLGYYSRAHNLHRCARQVVGLHGGRFPESAVALTTLPGIGRSTAAAIAAFCFGERVAILDGNVKRVLSRLLGFAGDLSQAGPQRALWLEAERLLPGEDIAAYTQGLMDLGATLCTVRAPRCAECPVRPLCRAAGEGQPEAYPVKSRKLRRSRREHTWLWLRWGDRTWLSRRPDEGIWAGLWSLAEYDSPAALANASASWPGRAERLPSLVHSLTHLDWTLHPVRHSIPDGIGAAEVDRVTASLADGAWFAPDTALALGLPAPVRKLISAG